MKDDRIVFVAALVICTGLLLFACIRDAYAKPVMVGQDEAAIHENSHGLRGRGLLAFKDLGATRIRLNMLQWRDSDPDAPFAVARAGLRPQLTLAGDLGYIADTVRRYRNVVGTYSVWNEPDLGAWRCCTAPFVEAAGTGNHHSYRAHYKAAYRIIKRLDPGSKVMVGELSPHGMARWPVSRKPWFGKVLRRGKPLRADCVAIHPYWWAWSVTVDNAYRDGLRLWRSYVAIWAKRRMLLTPKGRRVPICNTESGEPVQWHQQARSRHAYVMCARLGFRQCAQYQIFPSGQDWNTSLTDAFCRPTRGFLLLRKALRGVPVSRPVPWKPCPDAAPFIKTPEGPGPYDRYGGRADGPS